MKWYKASEYKEIVQNLKTLETMAFLTDVVCPVWLVMNEDKTEIGFAVNLLGKWVKAYNDHAEYLSDVAYFAPVTDAFMSPSPTWRDNFKGV